MIISACSPTNPELNPAPDEEIALFGDTDIDAAILDVSEASAVNPSRVVDAPEGDEFDLSSMEAEFSSQAVLPSASGLVAYIRHDPGVFSPWRIYLFDQASNTKTLIYRGRRELQSVASDTTGDTVVFVGRRNANPTSSFEVFMLDVSGGTVTRLTHTSAIDEANVSLTGDAAIAVWEGERFGRRAVRWREFGVGNFVLVNGRPNVMPSIAGDYIAFIRVKASGDHQVQLYEISSGTLTIVASNAAAKKHPSPSADGNKVAWTQTTGTGADRVKIKDLSLGITNNIVTNTNGIEHAHMTSDGQFLTYGLLKSGYWHVFTREIGGGVARGTFGTGKDHLGMFWQVPATIPGNILFDETHDNHNYLDPADPNNFGDAWSLGGWRDTVEAAGNQVDKAQAGPITLALLQPYELFVISPPRVAFGGAEITAIGQYVAQGGAVLFIGEFGTSGGGIDSLSPGVGTAGAGGVGGGGLTQQGVSAQYEVPGTLMNAVSSQFGVTLDLTQTPGQNTTELTSHAINAGNSEYSYNFASSVSGGDQVFLTPLGLNRIMATASSQDGCIAMVGDTNIWADNYGVGLVDNDALAVNTVDWLTTRVAGKCLAAGSTGVVTGTVSHGTSSTQSFQTQAVDVHEDAAAPAGSARPDEAKRLDAGNVTDSAQRVDLTSRYPSQELDSWADARPGVDYVAGEILVGFRDSSLSVSTANAATMSAAQAQALNNSVASLANTLAQERGYQTLGTIPTLGVARMQLPAGTSITAAMQALQGDPRVAFVEPNGLMWAHQVNEEDVPRTASAVSSDAVTQSRTPEDPNVGNQFWHYSMVGGHRAWDTNFSATWVRVAVIDTGWRSDHPDVPVNVSTDDHDFISTGTVARCAANGGGTIPRNWDNTGYDGDGRNWMDYNFNSALGCATTPDTAGSHGSHVMGTIGAAWNTVGGVGLANFATFIPIQALDVVGSGSFFDIAQAVLYAGGLPADADGVAGGATITIPGGRADVANMSLGCTGPSTGGCNNATMAAAVTAASNNGMLIIASAGNAATTTTSYPAAYPEAVAVTALGPDWTLASYSNRGNWVEVTAPGGDFGDSPSDGVYSTTFDYSGCPPFPTLCTTSNGGVANYADYQGTSMAAPHVTGVAAQYLADHAWNRATLRANLSNLAVEWGAAGFDTLYGNGLVQARPGSGVDLVNSGGTRRAYLIDGNTGAQVATTITDGSGNYTFNNVANGSYYVLAASNPINSSVAGSSDNRETGESIGAYSTTGQFQNASTINVAGNVVTADITLGWPGSEPGNNTPAVANTMFVDFFIESWDSAVNDDDYFKILVPTAGTYTIYTDGRNTPLCGQRKGGNGHYDESDTVIELYASDGTTLLASNDDGGPGYCSQITMALNPGTYYVNVRRFAGGFGNFEKTILRFDSP